MTATNDDINKEIDKSQLEFEILKLNGAIQKQKFRIQDLETALGTLLLLKSYEGEDRDKVWMEQAKWNAWEFARRTFMGIK